MNYLKNIKTSIHRVTLVNSETAPRYLRIGERRVYQKTGNLEPERTKTYHYMRYTMVALVNPTYCPLWRVEKQQNHFPLQKRNEDKNSHLYRFVHDQKYITHINIYITGLHQLVQFWRSLTWPRSMFHHRQN